MITLQPGTPVRIVSGLHAGLTGTILQGSHWPRRGKYSPSGTLYQVQIDGVNEQSRSIRSNVVRCWDSDLERFNQ